MNVEAWQQLHNINDSQLARLLEVSPSLISHIKAKRRNWSKNLAAQMEKLSNGTVSHSELLYPEYNKAASTPPP